VRTTIVAGPDAVIGAKHGDLPTVYTQHPDALRRKLGERQQALPVALVIVGLVHYGRHRHILLQKNSAQYKS
jgi:hypothetical protein